MSDIEKNMLIFEDLRDEQFKAVNSAVGLDVDHLKLTLLTLAKWHAGTATLLQTVRVLTNKTIRRFAITNDNFPILSFRMHSSSIGVGKASIIEKQ